MIKSVVNQQSVQKHFWHVHFPLFYTYYLAFGFGNGTMRFKQSLAVMGRTIDCTYIR